MRLCWVIQNISERLRAQRDGLKKGKYATRVGLPRPVNTTYSKRRTGKYSARKRTKIGYPGTTPV